ERARLFRALPLPIAHATELGPGAVAVREVDGVSLVLTRVESRVHAFKNACRHRGVRLLREDCRAKAFACPYPGWTYPTDGRRLQVRHEAALAWDLRSAEGGRHPEGAWKKDRNRVPVVAEERHGLVWFTLDEGAAQAGVASFLGEIDEELASLHFDSHVVGAR